MTGIDFSASVCLISASTSRPSVPGKLRSSRMTLGRGADGTSAPRPSVILLDLNLPGPDGREVLAEIKQTDALKSIPVIVLTTSTDDRDIQGCYQMGANSYVKKPVDLEG